MPTDCDNCPFFNEGIDYPSCNATGYSRGYNWNPRGQRMPDCPLIEVTEDVQTVKWIPVTERLPDFEGMCLCMRKSYTNEKIRHQEIMYFDFDEQAFCSNVDGIFVADGNVTHWMPLPEPPKDGEA